MSKKQPTVALSSTEAEYIASTHVIQEGLWLRSLLAELNIPFVSPVPLYLDNSGAIALSTAAKFHQHTKHIDIQYHFIRFHIDNRSFLLIWVPSHRNYQVLGVEQVSVDAKEGGNDYCIYLGVEQVYYT